ncbi:alpha/beta fold hydrolase [Streptomyces sp. NPDC052114]|uniref:thioesterase II family protein n=1 Tax=unclassified Streptomyces TaxID=2593676 RepID=UPI0034298676
MRRTRRDHCLRTLAEAPAPTSRLVCVPHSGGSVAAYGAWAAALPPTVEMLAVQYPGHGDRFSEPLSTDVRALSSELSSELLRLDTLPTVLFGHSLGALVAYESALTSTALGSPPSGLLVSSCPPPGKAVRALPGPLTDTELWSLIRSLGGVDAAAADDAELADVLLPVLRADIAAHENYRPEARTATLACPIRCYHGIQDPLVDGALLGDWASRTTGPFTLAEREGHHFHVFQHTESLLADIVSFLGTDSLTRS